MGKTKDKKREIWVNTIVPFVIIPLVIIAVVGYLWFYSIFLAYPPLGEENVASYQKLVQISNNNTTLKLEDVFTFEWDKAYILSDKDEAYEKLNKIIHDDLGALDRTENHLEIVFVSDNKLVNEFIYDADFIRFFPLDCFVEKGALFHIKKSNGIVEFTAGKYNISN